MNKTMATAFFVAAATLASIVPSGAETVGTRTFSFATSTNGLAVADFGRQTGPVAFTDTFDFTLLDPATLESAGAQGTNLSALNLQLAVVAPATFTDGGSTSVAVPDGSAAFANQLATNLSAGVYQLIITGVGTNTVPNVIANYFGQLRISFATPLNPVPIPGALPLLASVLGIGGYVRYRRKRNAEAVPA